MWLLLFLWEYQPYKSKCFAPKRKTAIHDCGWQSCINTLIVESYFSSLSKSERKASRSASRPSIRSPPTMTVSSSAR